MPIVNKNEIVMRDSMGFGVGGLKNHLMRWDMMCWLKADGGLNLPELGILECCCRIFYLFHQNRVTMWVVSNTKWLGWSMCYRL